MGVVSHGSGYYWLVKGGRGREGPGPGWGTPALGERREEEEPATRKRRGVWRERGQSGGGFIKCRKESSLAGVRLETGPGTGERPKLENSVGPPSCGHMTVTGDSSEGGFAGLEHSK